MTDVIIDFNVNDSPASVVELCRRIVPLFALPDGGEAAVDLSRCKYLGPDAAAILYACALMVPLLGLSVSYALPAEPPALAAFCVFSGLRQQLVEGPAPDASHPSCVTVPLRRHLAARHDDIDPVIRLVRAFSTLSTDRAESLGVAFNEVLQNVVDHSASPIGATSSARFLQGKHELRVAIVDMGRGIGTTLRHAYPAIHSTREALAKSLEGGYTARSRANNAGQGLSNLQLCTVTPGGRLFVLSEDAYVTVSPDQQPITHQLPFRFPGTGVFFTLPTL